MYDSLMDHFLCQSSRLARALPKNQVEARELVRRPQPAMVNIEEAATTLSPWKPTRAELGAMVTLAVCSLVVALDATILVLVLPAMVKDLEETATGASWMATSYLLAHAVLQPFIAALSTIFSWQDMLVTSVLFFGAGSVACATAKTCAVMLIGRVTQRVGGAGIIALAQVVFADLVPLRQRPKYFTMVLGAWALDSVLGPLVGGLFGEKASWRRCFYVNLPICGIALPMTTFFLTTKRKLQSGLFTRLRVIDWIGNGLFVVSLTNFLIAITWAGVSFGWQDSHTIVPLVLRGAGVSAVHSFDPIRTGSSLFPTTTIVLPSAAVVSFLITRTGKFRWAVWVGYGMSTLSAGLYTMWDDRTGTSVWAACECCFGLGMGMVLSSVNISIQAAVEPKEAGLAAAMYAFMRSVGMTIGVTVGGTVFQNTMRWKLQVLGVPDAAELAKHAEAYVQELENMSTNGTTGVVRGHIVQNYVHGFRIMMTALCAAGFLVSMLIQEGSFLGQWSGSCRDSAVFLYLFFTESEVSLHDASLHGCCTANTSHAIKTATI